MTAAADNNGSDKAFCTYCKGEENSIDACYMKNLEPRNNRKSEMRRGLVNEYKKKGGSKLANNTQPNKNTERRINFHTNASEKHGPYECNCEPEDFQAQKHWNGYTSSHQTKNTSTYTSY